MGTRGRTGRRWAAALCVCLLAGLLPGAALAAEEWTDGLDLTNVTQDMTYTSDSKGRAEWDYDTRTLTLIDVTIDNQTGDSAGISYEGDDPLDDPLNVVVRGDCSVSGGRYSILGVLGLTVEVEAGASLTAGGGSAGLGAGQASTGLKFGNVILAVTVAQRGRLTVSGGYGIGNNGDNSSSVTIENHGTLTASATGPGYGGVYCAGGTVELSGTGTTLCAGGQGSYGVYGGTGVTVAAGVKGLAAGGSGGLQSGGGNLENNAGGFLVLDRTVDAIDEEDRSGGLDLTDVAESTFYTDVGGGYALWEADQKTLTLGGVTINSQTSGSAGIYYAGAVGDSLTVVVRGDCTVSGKQFGILGGNGLAVEVGEDASLNAKGSNWAGLGAGHSLVAELGGASPLEVTVAQGGRSPPPGILGSATTQPAVPASRLKTTGR